MQGKGNPLDSQGLTVKFLQDVSTAILQPSSEHKQLRQNSVVVCVVKKDNIITLSLKKLYCVGFYYYCLPNTNVPV